MTYGAVDGLDTSQMKSRRPAEKWGIESRVVPETPFSPFGQEVDAANISSGKQTLGLNTGEGQSDTAIGTNMHGVNLETSKPEGAASPTTAIFNYCMFGDTSRLPSSLLSLVPTNTSQSEASVEPTVGISENISSQSHHAADTPRSHGFDPPGPKVREPSNMAKGLSPMSCHLIDDLVKATSQSVGAQAANSGVFDAMDNLISDANSSPFSLTTPVPEQSVYHENINQAVLNESQGENLDTGILSQSLGDPYSGAPAQSISCGPYSQTGKNIVGIDECPDRQIEGSMSLPLSSRKLLRVTDGAISKPQHASIRVSRANNSGTSTKAVTKRKPRTYSRATPSQHCHVCSRRPTDASPHAACGNLAHGMCRKTICQKCFLKYGWNLADAREASKTGWLCPHCQGICPDRAQCHIYDRTSERRRNKTVNHRKPKQSTVVGTLQASTPISLPGAPVTEKKVSQRKLPTSLEIRFSQEAKLGPSAKRQNSKKGGKKSPPQLDLPSRRTERVGNMTRGVENRAQYEASNPGGPPNEYFNALPINYSQDELFPESLPQPTSPHGSLGQEYSSLLQPCTPLLVAKYKKERGKIQIGKSSVRLVASQGKINGDIETDSSFLPYHQALENVLASGNDQMPPPPELSAEGLDPPSSESVIDNFVQYDSCRAANELFPLGLGEVMGVYRGEDEASEGKGGGTN